MEQLKLNEMQYEYPHGFLTGELCLILWHTDYRTTSKPYKLFGNSVKLLDRGIIMSWSHINTVHDFLYWLNYQQLYIPRYILYSKVQEPFIIFQLEKESNF